MITFDEKIVGVWFLSISTEQDWMASLSEIEPGKYKLTYRFRYYNPESTDPWDGKDHKNWYAGVLTTSRDEAISGISKIAAALVAAGAIGEVFEVLNHGDYNKFIEDFQAQPWVFSRQETGVEGDEQFEEFMKDIGAGDGSIN